MMGDIKLESSGACLFMSIPEDVFAVMSRSLSPSDICNLGLCCKSLCNLVELEKVWLVQCEVLKVLPTSEIVQWRTGVVSYKAICRFLVEVLKPLAGVWIGRYPELGNVVYVMPGFLSVVGCRIIPQTVGPSGIEEGRVMWSPVFEIICGFDGSISFFLHGRDKEGSCIYPGLVTGIGKRCYILLLKVEPRRSETNREDVSFFGLQYSDRRKLLDLVTSHVGVHVLESISRKLFPCSNDDDEAKLLERRTMLLKMHKFGGSWKDMKLEEERLCYNPTQVDLNMKFGDDNDDDDEVEIHSTKRRFASYTEHILWKTYLPSETERTDRQSFLTSGDTFSIGLKASYINRSSYQCLPVMPQPFALYKVPIKNPLDNELYAGLWGGTFGWPLGTCIEEKSEKSLYLLTLSYNESQENTDERVLIGTKILNCNVDHPIGSAMFVVNIDRPSLEPFPFDTDGKNIEHSYTGKGIASGYGIRNPGSTPGCLFVISNDHIAFVWQQTKAVLTLQRVNLEKILKKGLGLCMLPNLPPTDNFAYMKRSHSNVFTRPSTD